MKKLFPPAPSKTPPHKTSSSPTNPPSDLPLHLNSPTPLLLPMAMWPPSSSSFFGGLWARELSGSSGAFAHASAARLHYLSDLSSDPGGHGSGVISIEQFGNPAIPFAVSFCKIKACCPTDPKPPFPLFCAKLDLATDRAHAILSPPFPLAAQISCLLAIADEDGYVSLYDTQRCLPSRSSSLEKSG
jgi:denticleless